MATTINRIQATPPVLKHTTPTANKNKMMANFINWANNPNASHAIMKNAMSMNISIIRTARY